MLRVISFATLILVLSAAPLAFASEVSSNSGASTQTVQQTVARATPGGSPGSSTLLTPITCAGAAWAILGLVSLVPNGP